MRRLTSGGRLPRLIIGAAAVLLTITSSLPTDRAEGKVPPLRYAGGEYATFDPAFIDSATDVQLLLQLYAGLTRLDENGIPYASLAQSWSLSDGGATYTFHMRSGLAFSDGSSLDANDVRRSWLRVLDPATHSTAPDVLSIIKGATERLAGGPEDGVGIEVKDPLTLVVHLKQPAGYFLSIAATPTAFVVPRSANASSDWQKIGSFVGSGPYEADAMDGADLVLKANSHYVAGAPPIQEVRWVTDLTGDAATAFADNQIDVTAIGSGDASWIAYDTALGPALHRAPALGVQYFGFDTTRPPFDDARVRRAFALALDRPRLVGLAEPTGTVAASSVVPGALWPAGLPDDQTVDPDEARRLLAEAGYADRSKLGTITINGSGLGVGPAVAIWERELGVTINVESMAFRDYLRALESSPPQIFTINWIADYPSPYALYSLLLLPDATSNYGRWNDPEFVRLLDTASAAVGISAQATAYRAVDARVDQEAPVIPWSYGAAWWLVRPGLRGLGNLTVGLTDFGRVSWDN
jgi:oligopeptide transport system substrate-binding protein